MRILHIDTGQTMRGGQWQVLYLLEALRAGGHEVTLLAPRSSPLFAAASEKSLDARPLGLARIARLSRGADLAHAHDARAHTLAVLAARGPVVVARRVAFPVRRGPLSRWKYSRAAHFIAVSAFAKKRLLEAGVDAARVTVVYDGVPAAARASAGRRVLAPRTDDPRKGSALVREAAALAGADVQFSCDLTHELGRAGMLVYITHEEGLGSGALLAMAAGVPVIASRVGGLPEIVEDGVTGILVENTPEAIAAAIKRLAGDRALALRLGAAARERAARDFSVEKMAEGTVRVYERVLAC